MRSWLNVISVRLYASAEQPAACGSLPWQVDPLHVAAKADWGAAIMNVARSATASANLRMVKWFHLVVSPPASRAGQRCPGRDAETIPRAPGVDNQRGVRLWSTFGQAVCAAGGLRTRFGVQGADTAHCSPRASGGTADALASGASVRKGVGVQIPPRAHLPGEFPWTNGRSLPEWGTRPFARSGWSPPVLLSRTVTALSTTSPPPTGRGLRPLTRSGRTSPCLP